MPQILLHHTSLGQQLPMYVTLVLDLPVELVEHVKEMALVQMVCGVEWPQPVKVKIIKQLH